MIRLRAVGECVIETSRARIGPDAEVAFAVLVVILLAPGRSVARRRLVELLWPATSEQRARHNLRQALYKLRQLGAAIETAGHDIRVAAAEVEDDPLLTADSDGPPPPSLLRPDEPFGELLTGYRPTLSAPFAAWLEEQRGIVHARLRRIVLRGLAEQRRRGNWGVVELLARKMLQLDPLNEDATLALAEATALSGSKRAALAILDGYLDEMGDGAADLREPVLARRRCISERLDTAPPLSASERCFVGRAESMALLATHFRRIIGGDRTAQALLVWGEAGMGKSRLLAEFESLVTLDGGRLQRVGCQPLDVERPLSIWMDVVPALLELPGALGCDPESLGYLKRLTDHDPAVLEPSAATREAELLFAGVRQAIFDLIDAVASEAPLVLCVEDVHWLDARSWRVLRELITWLAGRPVLVVATSQQSHESAASRATGAAREPWRLASHRLPPLAHADALELFDAVTQGSRPPAAFRDWCVHLASGNPFHVRLLAVHWLETRELRAPTSLAVLIDARVARLADMPLYALQACAVLGRNATFDRVESVLEFPRHVLMEGLGELEELGFLATGEGGVPCKHDLIATSALARLTEPARQRLHRCAGVVLEGEIERTQSASLLWDCAQQWQAAGERDRALRLVRSCASHLLEVGLPHEAAEVYEKALELCETDAERVEMYTGLTGAAHAGGLWDRLINALDAQERILGSTGDLDRDASSRDLLRLEARWRLNQDIRQLLNVARAMASDLSELPLSRIRAAVLALIFADNLCDSHSAREILAIIDAAPSPTADAHQKLLRKVATIIFHSSYGDLRLAMATALEIAATVEVAPNPAERVRHLCRASIPLRRGGRYPEAIAILRTALDDAETLGLASAACSAADSLATSFVELGDNDAARRWYQRGRRWLKSQEGSAAHESLDYLGAKLAMRGDQLDEAAHLLSHNIDVVCRDAAVRRRVEGLALRLDLMLLRGVEIDRRALRQLEADHQLIKHFGGQDYPTEVLVRALAHEGDQERAFFILEAYITAARRELSPVPPALQSLRRSSLAHG